MPPQAPEPVGRRVFSSVDDVIAGMREILEPLPRSDGVACFTRLYLEVTKAVQTELAGAGFADPRFLEELDVAFARLFFDATDAHTRVSREVPAAWVPLFEARSRRGIAPLQLCSQA